MCTSNNKKSALAFSFIQDLNSSLAPDSQVFDPQQHPPDMDFVVVCTTSPGDKSK